MGDFGKARANQTFIGECGVTYEVLGKIAPNGRRNRYNRSGLYRVGHLLADLGWVDLDLECSIILPGQ